MNLNTGDTAFMILCAALVFFMTPGLAFFYGGMVRRKNVCNTMMACAAIMGAAVVMWMLFGYSLSFGGESRRDHRRFSLGILKRRRYGSGSLRGLHSSSGVLCLSDDVCHYHAGADYRVPGGKNEI